MKLWLSLLFVVTVAVRQCWTTPTPAGNGQNQEVYDDVKDLESLRKEPSKPNDTEQNVQAGTSADKKAASSESEPQANSRSAIFRHRGITQAKKSKHYNEKNQQMNEAYGKYSGVQYSPADLAAYVFSTGDEEGVAVAVEELVREGMMGRTDAINYLQDVKQDLQYMKERYEMQRKMQEMRNRAYPKPQITQRVSNPPREQFVSEMAAEKREPKQPVAPPAVTTEHPHQVVIASTAEPKGPAESDSTTTHPRTESSLAEAVKEDDFKRRIKTNSAENSFDFSLEIIYRMAKDMFSQSILKDDPVAEDTLSNLATFLENEVGSKHISPAMKEKVLEVVSAALVDSLREYQRMMPENQPPAYDESGFYGHLADTTGPVVQKGGIPDTYRKYGGPMALPLSAKSNRPKSS